MYLRGSLGVVIHYVKKILVCKKDFVLRLVVNYCRLNVITVSLPFYMRAIEEVVDKLGNSKYFGNFI